MESKSIEPNSPQTIKLSTNAINENLESKICKIYKIKFYIEWFLKWIFYMDLQMVFFYKCFFVLFVHFCKCFSNVFNENLDSK
ncbi:hypothetical protein [Helicobacter sp. T3_23-1056]